jgi:hypothetical protein
MRFRMTTGRVRTLVGCVVIVAAFAVAAPLVWRLTLRDTAEPASVGEVLRRFRAEATQNGGRIPAGVYVYETTGFEYVSALGGRRHRYPARSTMTITPAPCGTSLQWDALTTRSNAVTVCSDGAALRLSRWSERHEFFGRTDRTDWRCEGAAWLPDDLTPGSVSRFRCRGGDSTQAGALTVVGMEDVLVGGTRVHAVRLRAEAREVGDARGALVDERWLEPETGLPLRILYRVRTKNRSLIGDVIFEERYELRLLSLEPRL